MLSDAEQLISAVALGSIIVIGVPANLIVLRVLFREKQLRRTSSSIFLVNLLLIDITNLLIVMPFSLAMVISQAWRPPDGLKKLNAFLGTSVELAAMLTLGVISLDRFAAVRKPLAYKARMTTGKAAQSNIYIWSQAIIFSLIPIPCDWYIFNERYMACTFVSYSTSVGFYVYVAFFICCNFVLSLVVILATYFYIFRVARSHNKRIADAIQPAQLFNLRNNYQRESFRRREIRTACKILFVIGAFIVCHLPYACLRLTELSTYKNNYHNIPESITVAAKWAAYSKSSFNPFIYFLQQSRFRKAFERLVKKRVSLTQEAKLISTVNRKPRIHILTPKVITESSTQESSNNQKNGSNLNQLNPCPSIHSTINEQFTKESVYIRSITVREATG